MCTRNFHSKSLTHNKVSTNVPHTIFMIFFSLPLQESFFCECCSGFAGQHCEEIDACTPSPCTNNGICVDLSQGHEGNSYQCLCPYGEHFLNELWYFPTFSCFHFTAPLSRYVCYIFPPTPQTCNSQADKLEFMAEACYAHVDAFNRIQRLW